MLETWTSEEPIAGSPPDGRRTEMLSWEYTGKFWEMDVPNAPIFPSIREGGPSRRIIGIGKDGIYT